MSLNTDGMPTEEEAQCEHQMTSIDNPRVTDWDSEEACVLEFDETCIDCGKRIGTEKQRFGFIEVVE